MKQILFSIALLFSTSAFSQTARDTTPPAEVDTTVTDTVNHADNAVVTFVQIHADGTADTLVVPVGGTIGDFTPTTKDAWVLLVNKLESLLLPFLAVLLTFLANFIPGIKKIRLSSTQLKRVMSVVGSLVVLVGGFFLKFQDGGSWLAWAIQHLDWVALSAGLYSLGLKDILNGLFKKSTPTA